MSVARRPDPLVYVVLMFAAILLLALLIGGPKAALTLVGGLVMGLLR